MTHPEPLLPGSLQQLDHLQRAAQLRDGRHRVLYIVVILEAVAVQLQERAQTREHPSDNSIVLTRTVLTPDSTGEAKLTKAFH